MASESQQLRNWLELPSDIMANIFRRVGVAEIFENVQKVCTTWYKICKDPAMWRVIHMEGFLKLNDKFLFQHDNLCKLVVDRSQGQLVDLTAVGFYNKDKFLQYFADRPWAGEHVKESIMYGNWLAKAIGENFTHLRHLELIGCRMSNVGLQAILDGCCHLESLDLRNCRNIDLNQDLQKRCSEQIKHLKLPDDSLEGCPYLYEHYGLLASIDSITLGSSFIRI